MSTDTLTGGAIARGLGGELRVRWPLKRSSEIFDLRYGKALVESSRRPGCVPVFGTNGQTGTHDESLFAGPGVIVGRKGAGHLGVHWTDADFWVIDTAYSLVPSANVDLRFAYYLVYYVGLNHLKNGTSNPSLTREAFGAQYFPVPPLDEQRAIAATLSALDDKIDSNQRTIDRLEALGAAFLDTVVEPDVFGIPRYEPSVVLGDLLATLETGSRPRGGVVASDIGVVSLGAESIQSAGVVATAEFKRVPDEFAASMRRGRLQDGDVLVYKDGGRPGNFTPHVSAFGEGFPTAVATINEHVYRVRARQGVSQGLLYWILRSPWMDQEMRKRGTGVAIPGLNSSNFRELPWPVLSPRSAEHLNRRLDPMLTGMLTLGAQSLRLARLREALLPELLSGRIRVIPPTSTPDLINELEHA
jgi:type I restriction enzyme S subunit